MSPTPLKFSRTHLQTILGQPFDGVNPTFCRLAFEFLFSLTSSEGKLGQGVREKVNSFSIVEISLSLEFSVYILHLLDGHEITPRKVSGISFLTYILCGPPSTQPMVN